MKAFESFLAPKLEEYITYRKGLGYRDKSLRSLLSYLDRYARGHAWDCMQPVFFLEFARELGAKLRPRTVNGITSAGRGFFQFLVRQQDLEHNPLQDIPSLSPGAYLPFVFAPEEIENMVGAICRRLDKDMHSFLRDLGVYMALMLIGRLGLRISEPLNMRRSHYRASEGSLYIEQTKFKKNRLIPIPAAVSREIENYLAVRKALLDEDHNSYLLAGDGQGKVSKKRVYEFFHQAVQGIGLAQARRIIANTTFGAPTPHSLRHSFAINILQAIKARGGSTQAALPVLAAYMGHRKYRYTAVYLKVLDAAHRQGLVDFCIHNQEDL